jgi:hypothetical protein
MFNLFVLIIDTNVIRLNGDRVHIRNLIAP